MPRMHAARSICVFSAISFLIRVRPLLRRASPRRRPQHQRTAFIINPHNQHNFLGARRITRYHTALLTEPDIAP